MQGPLALAGALTALTAVVHSVMGEVLIFRALRTRSLVPSGPAPPLRARHVHILWATWHLASVFGLACAALLLWIAVANVDGALARVVVHAVATAHLLGAVLVLGATRGRHPGWIALLLVALLGWWGVLR